MTQSRVAVTIALALIAAADLGAAPPRLNPTVKQIIRAISPERIEATLKKLESFGTRYVLSEQDHPSRGIGAAQRWIYSELQSYSPRLEVRYHRFSLKNGSGRGFI